MAAKPKGVNQKLLLAYLEGDRQWKRFHRMKHAKHMKKLAQAGHFKADNPEYSVAFWEAVIQANVLSLR